MASVSEGELAVDLLAERTAILDGIAGASEPTPFDKALPVLLLNLTHVLKANKRSTRLSGTFSELETVTVHPAASKTRSYPYSVYDVEEESEDECDVDMGCDEAGRGWEWCCRSMVMEGESIFGDSFHQSLLTQQDELESARLIPTLACVSKSAYLACKHFDAQTDLERTSSQWASAEQREMRGVRSATLLSLSLQLLRTGLLKKLSGEQICDLIDAMETMAILDSTKPPTLEEWKSMQQPDLQKPCLLWPPLPYKHILELYAKKSGDADARLRRKRSLNAPWGPELALTPLAAAWLELQQSAQQPEMHRTWLELILEARARSGEPPPALGTDPSILRETEGGRHVIMVVHPLSKLIFPYKFEGQKTMLLHD